MIPKKIYTYWHERDKDPEFVKRCWKTFTKYDSDIELVILDKNTLKIWKPKNFDSLKHWHQADWIRLYYLEKYGGIWLDASIVVLKSLRSWVDFRSNKLQGFGYYNANLDNLIFENWAIVSPKSHPFIIEWKNNFKEAIEMGFEEWGNQNENRICPANKKVDVPFYFSGEYLTMHRCFIKTVLNRGYKELSLKSAWTGKKAPLKVGSDPLHFFGHMYKEEKYAPIVKYTNIDRKFLRFISSIGLYNTNSVLYKHLVYKKPYLPVYIILGFILLVLFIFYLKKTN